MMSKFVASSDLGQWIVIVLGVVAAVTCGEGFGWPMGALPKIEQGMAGFDLTKSEESWMVTVVFAGNILSPVPTGYIMDSLGRSRSLLVLSATIIAPWVLILVFHNVEALFLARFLTGVWSGAAYTILPVYLAELVQPRIRGVSVSLMAIALYLGCLPAVGAGPYVTYDQLSGITLSVPILLFLGLLYVPESPYFFVLKQRPESARKSLLRVREAKEVDGEMARIEDAVKAQMENKSTFMDIFSTRANRKAFLIVMVLGFIQRTSGLSILFTYATVTLPDSFVTKETSALLLVVVWIAAGALGVNGVDRFGRRRMFSLSCFGSSCAMTVVVVWFYLEEKTDTDMRPFNWIPLAALMAHGIVYSMGIISVPSIVQGELFAMNIKAKASSLSSINMAVFSAMVVKLFHPMQMTFGTFSIFVICMVSGIAGGIFAIFCMFETKGKSLEEIQEILNRTSKKDSTSL